jgi:lysophospholipase L1-like esterase
MAQRAGTAHGAEKTGGSFGAAAEHGGRGRRRRRGMLVAAGTLLVALVALEGAARLRFGAPLAERLPILRIQADAKTGWRMVPSLDHYTYQHHVRINALGLRGPEVGPKAPGERRVLALGDSLIYGQGVADDQTVPAHLAALLDGGGAWTVVNGGHRAFDTHQELALLDDLRASVEPDVVVLFWFWNDIRECDVPGTHARLTASGPVAFDTGVAMEGSAVWKWRMVQLARGSALAMAAHDVWRARKGRPPGPDEIDGALTRLAGYLDRFTALAAAAGFELLFVALPDANALLDEPGAAHFSTAIATRAEELAREHGWATCDVKTALVDLTRATGALPVLPYDGHYTGAANRAIAAAVAACLSGR